MRSAPALLAALVLLAACGDEAPPPLATTPGGSWRAVAETELDPRQQTQRDRALAARGAMFRVLFEALSAEMQRGGPAGAIDVCKESAPRIAEATAKAHGVRIGRTSFKLRNPANAGPAWVATLTADRPDALRLAAGPAGELGVLLPIKVQSACLACHGPEEKLADDVRARLKASYPEDRATGFAEGDLRGWFWVEVPAAP